MMWLSVGFVVIVLQALGVRATFQFTDCVPASSPMHVTQFSMSPDPIVLPGPVSVGVNASTNGRVCHSKVHVVLKKKHGILGIFDYKVPCQDHMGSCDYHDICTLLDDMEHGNWGHGALANVSRELKTLFNAYHVDYSCPLSTGALQLQNYVVTLPPVPHQFTALVDGDYHVEFKLTDSVTKHIVFCLQAKISIKHGPICSGDSCIVGRK